MGFRTFQRAKFNDFHSTGTGLTDHYLLRPILASNTEIKNNIFSSSVTVTGSSATLEVPAGSMGGFSSDYNDFFSANAFNSAIWGNASHALLRNTRGTFIAVDAFRDLP